MATVGQVWRDPDGGEWLVIGRTETGCLVGGQWRPVDLAAAGWVLVETATDLISTDQEMVGDNSIQEHV